VDADGDGVDDHVAEGCDEEGPEEPTVEENGTSNQTLDLDRDGVEDAVDRCPSTPTDELVDADGCSADQRRDLLTVGESSDGGMGWVVPAVAVVGALVALVGVLGMRQRAPSVGKDVSIPVALQHERPRPVLDGRVGSPARDEPKPTQCGRRRRHRSILGPRRRWPHAP